MSARTVLVTGGSKGIGRACAKRFWRDGHRVVATGRDEAALEALARDCPGVRTHAFDVGDADAWARAGLDADVLVANAGVERSLPLERTTLADWDQVMAINAGGVFLATQSVLPGMLERDWGRIVALGSIASHRGVKYGAAYTAAKHAVLGFVRAVAVEVAGSGVTANTVCPGFVETDMAARAVSTIVDATGRSEEDARKVLERTQPIGRLVDPEEVAAAVAYLASDQAAAVNGQSLVIDGGGLQQ